MVSMRDVQRKAQYTKLCYNYVCIKAYTHLPVWCIVAVWLAFDGRVVIDDLETLNANNQLSLVSLVARAFAAIIWLICTCSNGKGVLYKFCQLACWSRLTSQWATLFVSVWMIIDYGPIAYYLDIKMYSLTKVVTWDLARLYSAL